MDPIDETPRSGEGEEKPLVAVVGKKLPDRAFLPAGGAVIAEDGRIERPPSPRPWDTIIGPPRGVIPALPPRKGKGPSYYRGGRPRLTRARQAAIREQERRERAHGER